MKTLLNRWFVAFCLIWLTVFITRKIGHPIPYINGYIDDLIAIPVIANLGLWFQRSIIIKSNHYTLSVWHITFITVYVTLVFEVLLPRLSKTYTADWIDVVFYILGGVFFYRVMNHPSVMIKENIP